MRAKLGLNSAMPGDDALTAATLELLQAQGIGFTRFFRRLAGSSCRDLFVDREAFDN